MYYHILIETNEKIGTSNSNKNITEIDILNREEIICDIAKPYLSNEEFTVNGYILKKQDIIRLKIMTTEVSARVLSNAENRSMPSGVIMYVTPEDILSYDKYITDITKQILVEAKGNVTNNKGDENIKKKNILDKNKVFIVHGHDNEAKIEVARFVEKLGIEPIILHEQANDGMTIIEKIEKYSDVGFGIVLYTPCDMGYKNGEADKKMFRARQNVVFEHGFLLSKIGRNNVSALVKESVETPNDISGVVYIPMDANSGWKIPLAKEMKSSGYNIEFNLIM
ncbi:MAG: TIR domain-containing protein [Lachnotalea sp.]